MKYIGLDIGTSSCKASIIDECGTVSMSASREYTLTHPAPGFVEIDPELVWKSACDILREIAPASKDTVSIAVCLWRKIRIPEQYLLTTDRKSVV